MKNLFEIITKNINWDKIIVKTRDVIVDEADLTKTLYAINKRLGRCGTVEQITGVDSLEWPGSKKWIINIRLTNNTWRRLVNELKIVRVWNICDIPSGETKGIIYSYN